MALWYPLMLAAVLASTTTSQLLERSTRDLASLDYRLPRSIIPERYELRFVPFNPEQFTFTGTVTITVTVAQATDNITLHANYLNISSAAVKSVSTPVTDVVIKSVENSTDSRHFYVLWLNQSLIQGQKYHIIFEFTGELRDDMYGFYRSSYTVGNEDRLLAATQFESTHARRAFPCFDEPAFKATFKISIARSINMTALSNMPLESTSQPDAAVGGRVWDNFQETVKMSTYLVAFLVADFRNLTSVDGSFSTWARPDAVQLGAYSQAVGLQALGVLNNYADIVYALPKVDQVAIPDFAAGAMENWGLVTYREAGLLYDNTSSTTADKQSIALVIAHELTHQWFGNLVTLDWWSYTWLNEGFARFFQYYVMDKIESTWRMMDQLLLVQHTVFETDALASSASLDRDCNTPGEISAKFDSISYNKGASIIRMMQHVLTEDTFRKGLQGYLKARQYNTAVPSQLYSALQTQATADGGLVGTILTVEDLFTKWASQAGYPVIKVIRNYQNGTATVSQARFFLTNSTDSNMWCVPLSWTSQSNIATGFTVTTPSVWILDNQSSIQIQNVASNNDWVIFNNQQSGYYRVNYDEENWRRISAHLAGDKYQDIHALNRAQLVDDCLNLARAGHIDYQVALNLTRYLAKEKDYIPWVSALNGMSFLDRILVGSEGHNAFKVYLLSLLRSSYDSVGFRENTGDDHITTLHRRNVLTWSCKYELANCVQQANTSFNSWFTSTTPDQINPIAANLRSVVYCTAVAHGGEREWNFLWQRYANSKLAGEKTLILAALGCSKVTSILTTYLQKSISENTGIRKQDAASVFSAVYNNPDGINIALDFLVQNFTQISSFYGGMSAVSNVITGIANKLTTEQQVNKLESFVTANEARLDSAASAGKTAVESAKANLKWKTSNYNAIVTWLQQNNNSSAATGTASNRIASLPFSLICILLAYFLT